MRILRIVFLCIFLSLCSSSLLAGQRGLKVAAKKPDGKSIPLYSESYALVIGNGNYTNGWDPLPGAIKDVKDVARALEENGFHVIFNTDLTKAAFNDAFGRFCYEYGRDKNNRLLFYYAGHGHTEKMATDEDMGYLVMVNSPAPEKDPIGFNLSSVDMQVIVTQAKMIKSRHVLFMFDSCFSGSILNLRERVVPESISDSISLPVRQFITAGRANEPVPDHSIFKQAFLDLLEGRDKEPIPDGYITGEELGLYLKNKVPQYNARQHPQYGKINDIRLDKGDFVFALKMEPSIPSPAVPESGGIRDYEKIIQERETNRKQWDKWQSQLENDLAKVEQYDKSSVLNAKEKAEAWKGLLASYSADNPYSVKDDEFRKNAAERSRYWNDYKKAGKLFVDVSPANAGIKILNVGPKFFQGMELDSGSYHVEVSCTGYETQKEWVKLDTGEDKRIGIRLEKLQASIQAKTTDTRPSSTSNVMERDGIYVAYANGIVKDTKTGLEWKVGPDKSTTWDEARSWVESLNLDGGGWRMPSMGELEGLYKNRPGSSNMTPLFKTTGWYVWSGETKGSSFARYFDFLDGYRDSITRSTSNNRRAFAVRSRSDG